MDIRNAAIHAEYNVFSSNKVVTTYRRKMAFSMAEVKRKTDQWELHDILSEFDPQSYALVDDGHRQVNSEEITYQK